MATMDSPCLISRQLLTAMSRKTNMTHPVQPVPGELASSVAWPLVAKKWLFFRQCPPKINQKAPKSAHFSKELLDSLLGADRMRYTWGYISGYIEKGNLHMVGYPFLKVVSWPISVHSWLLFYCFAIFFASAINSWNSALYPCGSLSSPLPTSSWAMS